MSIGMNIEALRKRNNLKQSELGKLLNVSNKTVSSWERGRTEPNIGMVEKMCSVFHCTKTEIIDGASEEMPHGMESLSFEEKAIVSAYRLLDDNQKVLVCQMLGVKRDLQSSMEA